MQKAINSVLLAYSEISKKKRINSDAESPI